MAAFVQTVDAGGVPPPEPTPLQGGLAEGGMQIPPSPYFAYSTLRVSRRTTTLIRPT